jgi:peptidyl-prolyl cis-trans isomerase A (cyclophilin A)
MLFVVLSAAAFQAPQTRFPRSRIAGPTVACATGWTTSSTGLKYADEKVGNGEEAQKGCAVQFHYSSRIVDGQELDSSRGVSPKGKPYRPVEIELGAQSANVIPGWEEGIEGVPANERQRVAHPLASQ